MVVDVYSLLPSMSRSHNATIRFVKLQNVTTTKLFQDTAPLDKGDYVSQDVT
jgi:hypothetical protein